MSEDFYKTLLESTKAIPWKIDWSSLKFSYSGPQIEQILGWPVDSWVSADDWAARIHEDERDQIVSFCVAQSKAGIDHEADYRAITKDGNYVWIRDVVHVVRNAQGEVESLIGFMFDISERKSNEQALVMLQRELEVLSYKDSLTGIANRRRFDTFIEAEWRKSMKKKQPISLIMIDIDYFKQYNDHFGHLTGDECLKLVTRVLTSEGMRNEDFFARFGGEEFALVLANTNAEQAQEVAERCRTRILAKEIPHPKSALSNMLTISLGIGTIIPNEDDSLLSFIDTVDKRLYQAKKAGRNCTYSGESSLSRSA